MSHPTPEDAAAQRAQMDRIEAKIDELLAFRDLVTETAAPLLGGKGRMWMAMLATAKGKT